MEPGELLLRAHELLQSVANQAGPDDSRERVVELREWEVTNIERWLQDYAGSEWARDLNAKIAKSGMRSTD